MDNPEGGGGGGEREADQSQTALKTLAAAGRNGVEEETLDDRPGQAIGDGQQQLAVRQAELCLQSGQEEMAVALRTEDEIGLAHPLDQALQTRKLTLNGPTAIGGSIQTMENFYEDNRVINKSHYHHHGDVNNYVTAAKIDVMQHHQSDILSSIQELSRVQIENNERVYVKTERFQLALNVMEKNGMLFIAGPPGIGKTCLGMAVLNHYASQNFVPLVLASYDEWRQLSGGKQRVLLMKFDEKLIKELNLNTLKTFAKEKTCLTVFTVHDHVLSDLGERARRFIYCVLDLTAMGPYSEDNKRKILLKHLEQQSKPFHEPAFMKIIRSDKSGLLFPLRCNQFAERVTETCCPVGLFTEQGDVSLCGLEPFTTIYVMPDVLSNYGKQVTVDPSFYSNFKYDRYVDHYDPKLHHPSVSLNDDDDIFYSVRHPNTRSWSKVQMENMIESGEFDDFMDHFETAGELHGVENDELITQFYQDSPLHVACRRKDIATARKLLESRECDPMAVNKRGFTSLHYACRDGCHATVALLLKYMTKVDIRDNDGWLPLHLACMMGYTETVELLLEKMKVCEQPKNKPLKGPIHLACHNYHKDFVEQLKSCKANSAQYPDRVTLCNACFSKYQSTLHTIAAHNKAIDVKVVGAEQNEAIYEETYSNGAKINEDTYSSLFLACIYGKTNVARLLLQNGACTEETTENIGYTPLVLSCRYGKENTVRLLLEYNATVTGDSTTTRLHDACFHGHLEVVRILLEHPMVSVYSLDKWGRLPLHAAVIGSTLDVTQITLSKEAEMYRESAKKQEEWEKMNGCTERSPYADQSEERTKKSKRKHLQIVKLLLAKIRKEDIDTKDFCAKTALEYACTMDGSRLDIVNALLDKGANPNEGSFENTPLHLASEDGNMALVRLLLDHKADMEVKRLDKVSGDSMTPLFHAVRKCHDQLVTFLVDRGARTDYHSKSLGSLLHCIDFETFTRLYSEEEMDGVEEHVLNIVQVLLRSGLDVNIRNGDNRTALFYFCNHGFPRVMRFMMDQGAENVDCIDLDVFNRQVVAKRFHDRCAKSYKILFDNNRDARFTADGSNEWDAVDSFLCFLIKKNSDLNLVLLSHLLIRGLENSRGDTALHLACKYCDSKEVSGLLVLGANINKQNSLGETPLFVACRAYSFGIVKTLLDYGADMELKNHHGNTALMAAVQGRRMNSNELIALLLERGAGIFSTNNENMMPAHDLVTLICGSGRPREQTLLEKGALSSHLHLTDSHGNTFLHIACSVKYAMVEEILLFMIQSGCPIDVVNEDGDTPLHTACGHAAHTDVVAMLLKHCKVNATNKKGNTPLHACCSTSGDLDVAKLLLEHGAEPQMTNNDQKGPLDVVPDIFIREKFHCLFKSFVRST